jgi:hypothetical protein
MRNTGLNAVNRAVARTGISQGQGRWQVTREPGNVAVGFYLRYARVAAKLEIGLESAEAARLEQEGTIEIAGGIERDLSRNLQGCRSLVRRARSELAEAAEVSDLERGLGTADRYFDPVLMADQGGDPDAQGVALRDNDRAVKADILETRRLAGPNECHGCLRHRFQAENSREEEFPFKDVILKIWVGVSRQLHFGD